MLLVILFLCAHLSAAQQLGGNFIGGGYSAGKKGGASIAEMQATAPDPNADFFGIKDHQAKQHDMDIAYETGNGDGFSQGSKGQFGTPTWHKTTCDRRAPESCCLVPCAVRLEMRPP